MLLTCNNSSYCRINAPFVYMTKAWFSLRCNCVCKHLDTSSRPFLSKRLLPGRSFLLLTMKVRDVKMSKHEKANFRLSTAFSDIDLNIHICLTTHL